GGGVGACGRRALAVALGHEPRRRCAGALPLGRLRAERGAHRVAPHGRARRDRPRQAAGLNAYSSAAGGCARQNAPVCPPGGSTSECRRRSADSSWAKARANDAVTRSCVDPHERKNLAPSRRRSAASPRASCEGSCAASSACDAPCSVPSAIGLKYPLHDSADANSRGCRRATSTPPYAPADRPAIDRALRLRIVGRCASVQGTTVSTTNDSRGPVHSPPYSVEELPEGATMMNGRTRPCWISWSAVSPSAIPYTIDDGDP